jgi:hypothetical protein
VQGISLHYNTWTVLDKLEVPLIPPESFHRNLEHVRNYHWNGRNRELLKCNYDPGLSLHFSLFSPVPDQFLLQTTFPRTSDMSVHLVTACSKLS